MVEEGKSKDKQIDDRDWAGLPDYLIEIVVEKLPLVDCLSFGCVCKPWKSITTKFFEGSSLGIPLCMKPGQIENITRTCLNVFDKNINPTFDIPMPEESIGSYILGSYCDWLFFGKLLEEDYALITLLNPFSGEKVVLPKIYNEYNTVVLSSVPSDPRCICMILHMFHGVAFWTSGAREWLVCRLNDFEGVIDALYHEGHFYLLGGCYNIAILDGKSVHDGILDIDYCIAIQVLRLKNPCFNIETRRYLVESSGDILLICRKLYCYGPPYRKICGFETFRMDVSQKEWVKLESFGDKVIFLGISCSRSFHAKNELGNNALANNIYFTNNSLTHCYSQAKFMSEFLDKRNDDDVDDWGVYRLHSEESDWPHKPSKHWAGVWVTAPIWWCLRQPMLNYQ